MSDDNVGKLVIFFWISAFYCFFFLSFPFPQASLTPLKSRKKQKLPSESLWRVRLTWYTQLHAKQILSTTYIHSFIPVSGYGGCYVLEELPSGVCLCDILFSVRTISSTKPFFIASENSYVWRARALRRPSSERCKTMGWSSLSSFCCSVFLYFF